MRLLVKLFLDPNVFVDPTLLEMMMLLDSMLLSARSSEFLMALRSSSLQ